MVQRLKSWWKSLSKLEDQPVPERDPIVNSSLAIPLALSSLLLMLSLVWAFYEEGWGLRPWRVYQDEFQELFVSALEKKKPVSREEEQAILASSGYQELLARLRQAEESRQSDLQSLEQQEQQIRQRLAILTRPFTTARSEIQAKRYEVETASASSRESLARQLDELRQRNYRIEFPDGPQDYTFGELEEEFNALKAEQGHVQQRKVELLRAPARLRRQLNEYVNNRLAGLTEVQLDGLIGEARGQGIYIRQIHNPEINLVDRCESCHLGIREPVTLTADEMGGRRVFVSHPQPELLALHDPETFGCSPCHNGNGVGTVSVTKAHGKYKHWLWPLFAKENFEAGCLQCHQNDRHLRYADTLTAGKDLFQYRGCMGCHPRDGFDTEPRETREVQKQITDLFAEKQAEQLKAERLLNLGDRAATNEEANQLYADAQAVTLDVAAIDARVDQLRVRADELLLEVKKPGPNLKEVRMKLRPEWIPRWIENPQAFRPDTKMPQFRLSPEDVQAVSAFIWQSGVEGPLDRQPQGNAERGRQIVESRGCLGCHSVGEGEQQHGGNFAANLSRVGEKANYDYLVRWVHAPRKRTLPYCPVHARDITPEDYAGQGLPFRFDLEYNRCPLGDHSLQVQNQNVMPSLRLTEPEARDIASYLMTQRHADAQYAPVPFIEDQALFDRGRFLVRHHGCAGCHEIAGLEDEGKIGTDLTLEGSKPIERLDFALLTHDAKKEGWYNHKGFFENKLRNPAVYDQGKIKEPLERLRMPNFHLSKEDIDRLTTFLLGSQESVVPEQYHFNPSDQRADVQAGWVVVKKYNCMGCHEFYAGQPTSLVDLPQYQGDGREKLPPNLIGEGARVNPNWLARFLENPALSREDVHRNGVRPYLDLRMPSFDLSAGEVQKLVKFFQALSRQPLPYLPVPQEPLTDRELVLARGLFTSQAAPCLRCHATGDPRTDQTKTAPNFALVSERLKPDWTRRWIVHPEIISPGTAMPSGLFREEAARWVFALGRVPGLESYPGDHADLVVRYMFQFTPQEQRRLTGR